MNSFVLCLWLAYSPLSLTPLDWYPDMDKCLSARRIDTTANVRAGMGGGATYFCREGHACMPRHAPPANIKVVTTRAMLEGM